MQESKQQNSADNTIKVVGPKNRFPRVKLVEPLPSGYLVFALEIDHRLPFIWSLESRAKKRAIGQLKQIATDLARRQDVKEATLFKTLLVPPGKSEFIDQRPDINISKFDIVLLIEFSTPEAARKFAADPATEALFVPAAQGARNQLQLLATNARNIGAVDHSRNGVFLFNYFYADSLEQNLGIWEYTAGWFTDQTGLNNSTLLLPDTGQDKSYTIINHCRWDSLWDILPALIFKKSFHTFVIANFEANNTAPIPILYKLA